MRIVQAIAALEATPVVVEFAQDPTPPACDIKLSSLPSELKLEQEASHSSNKDEVSLGQLEEDSANYRAEPLDNSETPSEQVCKLEQ
jgi:hypothetical protein